MAMLLPSTVYAGMATRHRPIEGACRVGIFGTAFQKEQKTTLGERGAICHEKNISRERRPALLSMNTLFQAKTDETIYDGFLNAGDTGELSTFVELMHEIFEEEDLKRMFGGDAVLTLFAPTNAAFEALFAALSEEELSDLQDPDGIRLERTRGPTAMSA